MKNIFFSVSGLIGLSLLAAGCQKDVTNRTANLPALQSGNQDLNAGSWKTGLIVQTRQLLGSPACSNNFTVVLPPILLKSSPCKKTLQKIRRIRLNTGQPEVF